MLGFELKFKDRVLNLPLEAGFIVTRRCIDQEEDISISVGCYDPQTDNMIDWLKEKLHLEDSIEIVIKQIGQVSEPLRVFDYHDHFNITKEEADKKTLLRFIILKEELQREGLI